MGRRQNARQRSRQARKRRLDADIVAEVVFVLGRVHEADGSPPKGGISNPVRNNRHLPAQVRTHHENTVQIVDSGDRRAQGGPQGIGLLVPEITGTQPVVDMVGAQVPGDAVEQIHLFHRGVGRHQEPEPVAALLRRILQRPGGFFQRQRPADVRPPTGTVDPRQRQPVLGVDTLVAEPVAVGDPGLVDGVVITRHDALELSPQDVPVKIGPGAVVGRDQRPRDHLPGPRAVAVGLVVERSHGAEIDDVAGQLMIDAALDPGADLHVLAAAGGAQFLDPRDLVAETHTAGAVDAAGHVRGDQRSQVLVLDDALLLRVTGHAAPVTHGQVLQLALPALIADRAVQGMVDEQEFHGGLLRRDRGGRTCEDLHPVHHRRGAGRQGLGRPAPPPPGTCGSWPPRSACGGSRSAARRRPRGR